MVDITSKQLISVWRQVLSLLMLTLTVTSSLDSKLLSGLLSNLTAEEQISLVREGLDTVFQNVLKHMHELEGGNKSQGVSTTIIAPVTAQEENITFHFFNNSKKTWYEAFQDCKQKGMDLATVENNEEYEYLSFLLDNSYNTDQDFWMYTTVLRRWYDSELQNYTDHSWMFSDCYARDFKRNSFEISNETSKFDDCSSFKNYICEKRSSDKEKLSKPVPKKFTVFTHKKISWKGAIHECRSHKMRLATIESKDEHREVVKRIKTMVSETDKGTPFWLFAADLGGTGEFVWMTNGQGVSEYTGKSKGSFVSSIDKNQIHRMDQHCLSIKKTHGYHLSDSNCFDKYYYICDNQGYM